MRISLSAASPLTHGTTSPVYWSHSRRSIPMGINGLPVHPDMPHC